MPRAIQSELGVPHQTIYKWLVKRKCVRSRSETYAMLREDHELWLKKSLATRQAKAKRESKTKQGYMVCTIDAKVNGGTRCVHRMIMEQYLGRRLLRDEVVHHINGDKSDNRIENLAVMKRSEHISLHHSGKKLYDAARDEMGKFARKH